MREREEEEEAGRSEEGMISTLGWYRLGRRGGVGGNGTVKS